ncbi:hypothetical protein Patl1_25049 [Pistacia atlantica]|uniref:Uncharacterized protein n=1 Tax=Pistacia atlantica TaxID=434234 RepID=A0ACC1AYS2_9ROSI|nr:hypothetical protein Patl1_25049 [Pistacia atlantica]
MFTATLSLHMLRAHFHIWMQVQGIDVVDCIIKKNPLCLVKFEDSYTKSDVLLMKKEFIYLKIAEPPVVESADLDIAEIEIPAIFPGDHHHHEPPVITEISTSQIFIHRTNQVPPATIAPTCNHVIGVHRTFVSSGIQGAPQGYSGAGLPNVGLGAYDVILEQGRQPNIFHGWLPEAQIPLPHQHAIYQNYPEPPFLVHHHVEEEVHAPPYEYFPEDMDFY